VDNPYAAAETRRTATHKIYPFLTIGLVQRGAVQASVPVLGNHEEILLQEARRSELRRPVPQTASTIAQWTIHAWRD